MATNFLMGRAASIIASPMHHLRVCAQHQHHLQHSHNHYTMPKTHLSLVSALYLLIALTFCSHFMWYIAHIHVLHINHINIDCMQWPVRSMVSYTNYAKILLQAFKQMIMHIIVVCVSYDQPKCALNGSFICANMLGRLKYSARPDQIDCILSIFYPLIIDGC